MQESKSGSVAVTDLENLDQVAYTLDTRTNDLLSALASIVVDEIMQLRDQGMKPADIEAYYAEEIPPMPTVPIRKRRQKKENA